MDSFKLSVRELANSMWTEILGVESLCLQGKKCTLQYKEDTYENTLGRGNACSNNKVYQG